MEPTEHFGIYFGYIRRLFQSWVSPFKGKNGYIIVNWNNNEYLSQNPFKTRPMTRPVKLEAPANKLWNWAILIFDVLVQADFDLKLINPTRTTDISDEDPNSLTTPWF